MAESAFAKDRLLVILPDVQNENGRPGRRRKPFDHLRSPLPARWLRPDDIQQSLRLHTAGCTLPLF